MSMSYSGGVFFGACVSRNTALGNKLEKYVDRHGGTPAKTEVSGVVISMVGDRSSSDIWMTVEAEGSARAFGLDNGDILAPELLVEDPTWRSAISGFLSTLGYHELPVGWHFETSIY